MGSHKVAATGTRIHPQHFGRGARGVTHTGARNVSKSGRPANVMLDPAAFSQAHPDLLVYMTPKKLQQLSSRTVEINGSPVNLLSLYMNAVVSHDWNDQSNTLFLAMSKHKLSWGNMNVVLRQKEGVRKVAFLGEDHLIRGLSGVKPISVMNAGIRRTAEFRSIEKTGHDWWIVYKESIRPGTSVLSIEILERQEETSRTLTEREEEEEAESFFEISVKIREG